MMDPMISTLLQLVAYGLLLTLGVVLGVALGMWV